ncbi:hypothetical protein GCM10009821_18560 [Aeromicrobium halocynthiae]|uniref:Type I restriction modification DNA specificity domain-containing protein n=1 Tax=Aeromicrobium halocynthiae TaxID=560557 RepID=A0ABN2VZY9_9ACTN
MTASATFPLPRHWQTAHLRHVADIPVTNGLGEAAADGEVDWPRYIRTTDITTFRSLDPAKRVTLPPAVAEGALVEAGDLLFTAAGSLGTSYQHRGGERACYAGYLVRLRPDESKILSDYAAWWSQSQHHLDQIRLGAVRSTIDNFSAGKFRSMSVPLPPLAEQRAIADYLDRETAQIDTLIEEQQRLMALLRERRRAEFDRVLTSDAAGQPVRLKHIVSAITQGWSPRAYPWPADGIEEWGVLKAGAVNNGVFRPAENKQLPDEVAPRPELVVRRGQIVVSRANTRDLVGSAALVEDDFPRLMLCDKLFAFDLDETLAYPPFVAMALNATYYRRLLEAEATGSSHSMQNISLTDITNLPLNLPSVSQQREVVQSIQARLERIDRSIAETERFVELSAERRAALITAAVTGQIDLEGAA